MILLLPEKPINLRELAQFRLPNLLEQPTTRFLFTGVGLGKTHLIQAIGNFVLTNTPLAKVRYIHSEQYVSDVVKAYRHKAFDEFKRYYHSLDLLLIDDIQFFGGKSRTQEEFFMLSMP